MEYINGPIPRTERIPNPSLPEGGDTPSVNRPAYQPPAKEFLHGRILTRVWANPNHWNDITWKVEQLRLRIGDGTMRAAKNFHVDDLSDAMRGIYQAQKWIRKAARRSRLFWWRR